MAIAMKKKLIYAPTAVFLAVMIVMTALFIITPKADYSPSEKRYLEDFPETNLTTVTNGEFETGFENYLADHFPFRNMWVGFNAYYNLLIGNNGNDGVYNCAEGYLINEPVSRENRVNTNLGVIADFAKSVDVPVTAMFTPSTGYSLGGVLPAAHGEYRDDEIFENVSEKLKNTRVDFVDLRESFKAPADPFKDNGYYYHTDHHWTTLGAYTAYTRLCAAIGKKPTDKESFNVWSYGGFYGTTYSTSGFWGTKPDNIEVWENPKNEGKIKVKITEGSESKTYDSMYFRDHLKEDDKYPVFLDGNHALETITNSRVKDGKVLVIKDSFCHSLAPFLADNYRKVTLVDMRYYKNSVSELLKKGKYDRVLFIYGIDNFATDTDFVWLK